MCDICLFTYSFGSCVPYKIREEGGTPCDVVYTAGVDYFYLSNRRTDGDIDRYLDLVEDSELITNVVPEKCFDPALRILCHFYFPPCGNSTIFQSPTSVCIEFCNYLQETCPFEWEIVIGYFEENDFWLRPIGLTFINCSNTGEYLDPLPYCCSDVGLQIRMFSFIIGVIDLYVQKKVYFIYTYTYVCYLHTACTELDGSGNLVSDPACFSSTSTVAQPSPSPTVSPGSSHQTSGSLAITVGSVCATVAVLLLMMTGVVMCILIKKHGKKSKLKGDISEPWSPTRYIYCMHMTTVLYMLIRSVTFHRMKSLQSLETSGRYHSEQFSIYSFKIILNSNDYCSGWELTATSPACTTKSCQSILGTHSPVE